MYNELIQQAPPELKELYMEIIRPDKTTTEELKKYLLNQKDWMISEMKELQIQLYGRHFFPEERKIEERKRWEELIKEVER